MEKTYLGDSVYADTDGYHVILTTDNGYGPSNTIFMDAEVLDALTRYVNRLTNATATTTSASAPDESEGGE